MNFCWICKLCKIRQFVEMMESIFPRQFLGVLLPVIFEKVQRLAIIHIELLTLCRMFYLKHDRRNEYLNHYNYTLIIVPNSYRVVSDRSIINHQISIKIITKNSLMQFKVKDLINEDFLINKNYKNS